MKFRIFSILSILLLFLVACDEKQEAKSPAPAVEATQEKPMAETMNPCAPMTKMPMSETPASETPVVSETPVSETPVSETPVSSEATNPCAKKNPVSPAKK